MPSKVINTFTANDRSFSINFKLISYDPSLHNQPTLDIWKDLIVGLQQEEKQNGFLYIYHGLKTTDSLESISQDYYGSINLWWLILLVNDANDPFNFIQEKLYNDDLSIKVLKQEYINKIYSTNNTNDLSEYVGIKDAV